MAHPLHLGQVLKEVYAHAREGYPEEVCGFLVQPEAEGAPLELRRCDNRQNALHAEDPAHFPRDARTAYNLGPKDLLFLDRSLSGPRPVRIIYHSHIEVGAYFSDEDTRAATSFGELTYPVDYLVIDVRKDGVRGAKLFRFTEGAFVEVGAYGP
jgi:proteasome lid subunit RPN8/RPN11